MLGVAEVGIHGRRSDVFSTKPGMGVKNLPLGLRFLEREAKVNMCYHTRARDGGAGGRVLAGSDEGVKGSQTP